MTVVCGVDKGWFLDHARAVKDIYIQCDHHDGGYKNLGLKSDMFQIENPFMMDSHFVNWKLQKQTGETKKRKKRKQLPSENTSLVELHLGLASAHETLVAEARKYGYLQHRIELPDDNNKLARQAANIEGPGDKLTEFSEMWAKGDNSWQSPCVLSGSDKLKLIDLFHRRVTFKGDNSSVIKVDEDHYVIPAKSSFVMSEFEQLLSNPDVLKTSPGYDLIVIDPPWTNKSVKRKKSYWSLDEERLLHLPVSDLASAGCVVAVWVTNKQRLLDFVRHQLFPAWSVQDVRQWSWLKVTTSGDLVCEMDSPTKKPYETLLLGRITKTVDCEPSTSNTTAGRGDNSELYGSTKGENSGLSVDKRGDYSSEMNKDKNTDEIQEESDSRRDCEQNLTHDNTSQESPLVESSQKTSGSHASAEVKAVPESVKGEKQDRKIIPDGKILLSVPCSLHSKKPPLQEALQLYLPPNPRCLELFARNLWPGWVSWGHEVLKHQHFDYYEET